MKIVYHLGVHCTDDERLLRCLLKNRDILATEGIVVPGPARYRTLIRDIAMALKGAPSTRHQQAEIMGQIMAEDTCERLILSWENFPGYAQGAARQTFYPSAAERMRAIRGVFPDTETEFHLAVRNPATFLPAVIQKQKARSHDAFMDGVDVMRLRWSEMIASLRTLVPDVPVTVWCDEDTPLIWPEVLQAVSGHSDAVELADTDDLLASIMTPEGLSRLQDYRADHPGQDAAQRRQVTSAFLDKFALPEAVEITLDMSGWTEETVAILSADYDLDMARIIAMDGVRFIAA